MGHKDPAKRMSLPDTIRMLASETAQPLGLGDRGLTAEGMKADVNVIDMAGLRLQAPLHKYDLPAGGRRLTQRVEGYVATIVSGQIVYRNGEATGLLLGRLVRGQRLAQAAE